MEDDEADLHHNHHGTAIYNINDERTIIEEEEESPNLFAESSRSKYS